MSKSRPKPGPAPPPKPGQTHVGLYGCPEPTPDPKRPPEGSDDDGQEDDQ